MNRIASVLAAVAMIVIAACDAPSIGSPSQNGVQPSFDKGGNVAVRECHDTATTNPGACGSVAVGGNKLPVITRFSYDSNSGPNAWFTAVFTGSGTVQVQSACLTNGTFGVTSGVPFVVDGAVFAGGYFTLTASNSFGSVTSQPINIGSSCS